MLCWGWIVEQKSSTQSDVSSNEPNPIENRGDTPFALLFVTG